jgi:DNA-binding NtrC family response regulator
MEKLLLIDDEAGIRSTIQSILQSDDLQVFVAANAEEGLHLMEKECPPIVMLDIRLGSASGLDVFEQLRLINPRVLVIFITGHGTTETAIETMKKGAYDYLVKPLDLDELCSTVEQARKICRQMYAPAAIELPSPDDEGSDRLIGSGSAMQSVCKQIGRVAPQDVNVLILGESGTGKELIARAIYQHSRRTQAPFLAINCAAIPETLLESELFGHEKGAFTGAEHRRIGKFEQCHRGTILLDEVGDMPLATQARILRLLQDGQFQRVGGNETINVDVRIIAATNQNVESMISDGRFRQDLYYRLRGVTILLPPLRNRIEDIPELAHYLMFRFNQQLRTAVQSIAPEAIEKLQCHRWPGNVRELQSVIREALILSTGPTLLPEFLPLENRPDIIEEPPLNTAPPAPTLDAWQELGRFVEQALSGEKEDFYRTAIQYFDQLVVLHAMNLAHGMQSRAAELLGLSRPTLRSKLRSIHSSGTYPMKPEVAPFRSEAIEARD